ncbi:comEA protein [Arthrobacter crystallopoietes BAB-32]|uniref:ComEA protein n=1 Tax=Arthrobacter crystallopoietes BAB-32 TaxID=1246476 RepID=N1UYT0_9MICC|nr:ComEA family DNA-binding protein [Arthrobacter crystallopoietes]EMY35551.1 comEA protein [Arthrobacter crystallopoietes BAB-32]
MGRHRWETAPIHHAGDRPAQPGRRPRWKIALGAALIAAGVVLGYGIVVVATADLNRAESDVLASLPVTSRATDPGESGGPSPTSARAEQPTEAAESPAGETIVHVAGAVRQPGIVRLGAAARVFEALEAAGGALPQADLAALNLAAPVADGQQIFVPSPDHPAPDSAASGSPGGPAAGGNAAGPAKINLNTATVDELTTLPRVGPVLAQRIVDFREQHGAFTRPEDLDAVPGIGEVMLANLIELVTI